MRAMILRRMAAGLILVLVCGGSAIGAQAQSVTIAADAYLQDGSPRTDTRLKVESGARVRVSYLKLTVANAGTVTSAKLRLRCSGDAGSGIVRVYKGSNTSWTSSSLSSSNAPAALEQVAQLNTTYTIGQDYDLDLSTMIKQDGTYNIVIKKDEAGGDVAFSSSRDTAAPGPKLLITVGSTPPPADTSVPQINQFTVTPEAGASAAIIDYSVTASSGTTLKEIQVHRALDSNGSPGTWKYLLNSSVDLSTQSKVSYAGSVRDGVTAGWYWYKILVVDKAGKVAEATPIKVNPAEEPGTVPDDPVVPPDDPVTPPSGADITAPKIDEYHVTAVSDAVKASISYAVSDAGGSYLKEIELWRAPDANGAAGEWKNLATMDKDVAAQNINTYSVIMVDGVGTAGWYWYKIRVFDQAGNAAEQSARVLLDPNTTTPTPPPVTAPICGQNGCESGETCATCPQDCGVCPVSSGKLPANPNATAKVKSVLNYLYSMPARSSNKVVSGQTFSWSTARQEEQYDEFITALHDQTGQYPGLVGTDLMFGPPDNEEPSNWANARLIADWKKGSLVTLNWHAANPVTLGGARDRDINFSNIYKEGTMENIAWKKQLDMAAKVLAELRDAGVVVLWRPMHEMQAEWWWGRRTDYDKAWQYMFNYFTYQKNLNNLLWVYGTTRTQGVDGLLAYYPGDAYVDVVGMSYYSGDIWSSVVPYYDTLRSRGKPFVLTELGLGGAATTRPPGPVDYGRIAKSIQQYMPDTAYFLCWHAEWAIVNNDNAYELMADPLVANRGELGF